MTSYQKMMLLHLLYGVTLVGVEPSDPEDIAAGKPVRLRFEKPSIIGGIQTHWSAPVTQEFADEAFEIARGRGRA